MRQSYLYNMNSCMGKTAYHIYCNAIVSLYLTSVTTAQLWGHLPNMNLIVCICFDHSSTRGKIANRINWFSYAHPKVNHAQESIIDWHLLQSILCHSEEAIVHSKCQHRMTLSILTSVEFAAHFNPSIMDHSINGSHSQTGDPFINTDQL